MTASSERPSALEELVGPFYDLAGVADVLRASPQQIGAMSARRALLRLPLGGGGAAYPAWQFDPDGRLVPHLAEVIDTLATGIDDPWTWAAWLCSEADGEYNGLPAWKWLAEGNPPDTVLLEARRDAARWRS